MSRTDPRSRVIMLLTSGAAYRAIGPLPAGERRYPWGPGSSVMRTLLRRHLHTSGRGGRLKHEVPSTRPVGAGRHTVAASSSAARQP